MGFETSAAESPESMLERVTPSVVTITMWRPKVEINPYDIGGEGQNYIAKIGGGSGFFVSENGYFITNKHCTVGSSIFTVELSDGTHARAMVVYEDPARDIAVMRVEGKGPFQPAELGDSSKLKRGQQIWTMGTPHGKKERVSSGVISGVPRMDESFHDIGDVDDDVDDQGKNSYHVGRDTYIDTDADIHAGNSGGPMLDAEGRVIGINTFIERTSAGSMGFALPINEVKVIAKHAETMANITGVMKEIDLARHDEELPLSVSFKLSILAAQEAVAHLDEAERKAVMGDSGIRRLFLQTLKYSRKNRQLYADAYETTFGVKLDDAPGEDIEEGDESEEVPVSKEK